MHMLHTMSTVHEVWQCARSCCIIMLLWCAEGLSQLLQLLDQPLASASSPDRSGATSDASHPAQPQGPEQQQLQAQLDPLPTATVRQQRSALHRYSSSELEPSGPLDRHLAAADQQRSLRPRRDASGRSEATQRPGLRSRQHPSSSSEPPHRVGLRPRHPASEGPEARHRSGFQASHQQPPGPSEASLRPHQQSSGSSAATARLGIRLQLPVPAPGALAGLRSQQPASSQPSLAQPEPSLQDPITSQRPTRHSARAATRAPAQQPYGAPDEPDEPASPQRAAPAPRHGAAVHRAQLRERVPGRESSASSQDMQEPPTSASRLPRLY